MNDYGGSSDVGATGRETCAYVGIKSQADTIIKQLTSIEEALHQTKAKSNQDVLNYPIRLDDKLAGLYKFAASGNTAPAQQGKETFTELSAQTDVQLNKLKQLLDDELPKLKQLIRDKSLSAIGLKE